METKSSTHEQKTPNGKRRREETSDKTPKSIVLKSTDLEHDIDLNDPEMARVFAWMKQHVPRLDTLPGAHTQRYSIDKAELMRYIYYTNTDVELRTAKNMRLSGYEPDTFVLAFPATHENKRLWVSPADWQALFREYVAVLNDQLMTYLHVLGFAPVTFRKHGLLQLPVLPAPHELDVVVTFHNGKARVTVSGDHDKLRRTLSIVDSDPIPEAVTGSNRVRISTPFVAIMHQEIAVEQRLQCLLDAEWCNAHPITWLTDTTSHPGQSKNVIDPLTLADPNMAKMMYEHQYTDLSGSLELSRIACNARRSALTERADQAVDAIIARYNTDGRFRSRFEEAAKEVWNEVTPPEVDHASSRCKIIPLELTPVPGPRATPPTKVEEQVDRLRRAKATAWDVNPDMLQADYATAMRAGADSATTMQRGLRYVRMAENALTAIARVVFRKEAIILTMKVLFGQYGIHPSVVGAGNLDIDSWVLQFLEIITNPIVLIPQSLVVREGYSIVQEDIDEVLQDTGTYPALNGTPFWLNTKSST